jgi:hypothetical protein
MSGIADIRDMAAAAGNGQEAALMGLHDFYGDQDKPCTRVYVREEMQAPLEKSRLYGPFSFEVVLFLQKLRTWGISSVQFGWDVEGREYVEY